MYCPKCSEFQEGYKKMSVYRVPRILIIHLKRFSKKGSRFGNRTTEKNSRTVIYPVDSLDMSKWIDGGINMQCEDLEYELFGVSVHSGGLGGGHYTAYTKNVITGEWFYMNDGRVGKARKDEVITPNAYLLFYQKKRK